MVTEDVLERFYKRIAEKGTISTSGIPESLVFFVRRGIEVRTGIVYPLEQIELNLFLMGRLNPDKYYKSGLPAWYVLKYYKGKHPDMEKLRRVLRAMYAVYTCYLEFNNQRVLNGNITASEDPSVSEADLEE